MIGFIKSNRPLSPSSGSEADRESIKPPVARRKKHVKKKPKTVYSHNLPVPCYACPFLAQNLLDSDENESDDDPAERSPMSFDWASNAEHSENSQNGDDSDTSSQHYSDAMDFQPTADMSPQAKAKALRKAYYERVQQLRQHHNKKMVELVHKFTGTLDDDDRERYLQCKKYNIDLQIEIEKRHALKEEKDRRLGCLVARIRTLRERLDVVLKGRSADAVEDFFHCREMTDPPHEHCRPTVTVRYSPPESVKRPGQEQQ